VPPSDGFFWEGDRFRRLQLSEGLDKNGDIFVLGEIRVMINYSAHLYSAALGVPVEYLTCPKP
jgi:hypothetical protein